MGIGKPFRLLHQPHFQRAANVRFEPRVVDAVRRTKGRDPARATTFQEFFGF